MPATAAFCTSSKLARPLTSSTAVDRGVRPSRNCGADELVQGVVPADVLAQGRAACRRHRTAPRHAGRPSGRRRAWAARRVAGSRWMTAASTTGRPLRQSDRAADPDRLHRRLAADAATRRRVEVPLQPRQVDRDARAAGRPGPRCPAPGADARDLLRGVDDPLGEQETDGQLAVMAGGPHRDRDAAADAPAVPVATRRISSGSSTASSSGWKSDSEPRIRHTETMATPGSVDRSRVSEGRTRDCSGGIREDPMSDSRVG